MEDTQIIITHNKYLKDIENATDRGIQLAKQKALSIGLKYIKNPNDVYGFKRDMLEINILMLKNGN